jgi:hypothetical protein
MNRTILDEIRIADMRGAPPSEMKKLYAELCAIGLDLKQPIHRIFQLNHLREDLERGCLTHVRVSPETWHDPYENPLLNREFREKAGEIISVKELLNSFFGICWTVNCQESLKHWRVFSHGNLSVRVSTTVGKLLAGVMNLENQFYMLSHFLGKVNYHAQSDIDRWLQDANYKDFPDPLGHKFASTLLMLRQCFDDEDEARLLYWHTPKGNEWVSG